MNESDESSHFVVQYKVTQITMVYINIHKYFSDM